MKDAKVRLYVDHPLGAGQSVPLDRDQAHYLFGVIRLTVGAQVLLFNSQDGEFRAEVINAGKRSGELNCLEQTKPLQMPPDLWLVFAPIKKARTDFIVEKAAEMGAARIVPMQTEFTNSERVRQDRLQAHAVEAAEQCGGTFVPEVADLQKFDRLLAKWPSDRRIMFCDEAEVGRSTLAPIAEAQSDRSAGTEKSEPWAIFIGPEGGFSDREREKLKAIAGSVTVSLGPRVLRADTAAVAAMTLWQKALGDWS